MVEKDLEKRTKKFALAAITLVSALPRSASSDVIARQLLRSATSIGANYREANRGVSRADFANKIGNVQKEAAETQYWIELLIEGRIGHAQTAAALHKESTELLAIFTTIGKRLKE
ncbi:MAG: four helix bundle protein [Chthoniobacterales bacterium]|nr:MAG: four helix bundle protein [Chthoniobacterales bacterium]